CLASARPDQWAVFAADLAQSPTTGENGGGGGAAGDGPHHPYGCPQALAAPRPDRCGIGPRRPAQPHHHAVSWRQIRFGKSHSNLAADARKARSAAGRRRAQPSAPGSRPAVLIAARKWRARAPAATVTGAPYSGPVQRLPRITKTT